MSTFKGHPDHPKFDTVLMSIPAAIGGTRKASVQLTCWRRVKTWQNCVLLIHLLHFWPKNKLCFHCLHASSFVKVFRKSKGFSLTWYHRKFIYICFLNNKSQYLVAYTTAKQVFIVFMQAALWKSLENQKDFPWLEIIGNSFTFSSRIISPNILLHIPQLNSFSCLHASSFVKVFRKSKGFSLTWDYRKFMKKSIRYQSNRHV